jgi:hypothetical protein
MRRFRQASILAQVNWKPSRVDLIERPQLCPGVQLRRNVALQKPACLLMKSPLQKPGQPSNACVTAVTKVGFYFFR